MQEIARLGIWLVILMLVFIPLERRFGLQRLAVLRRSFAIDVAYYFVNNLIPKLVLMIPLSLLAAAIHRYAPAGLYLWTDQMPTLLRAALAIVVAEIGSYWGHRWSHEIPLLWRFHSVHHSAEELDWLVNTRAHPVDMAFTRLCGLVPAYVLGLAQPAADRLDMLPLILTVAGSFWGFFIHANLNWRLGWLETLVSSPAFHHWHHGVELLGKNYAATLPVVDRLFGTFYLPRHWPQSYGVSLAPGVSRVDFTTMAETTRRDEDIPVALHQGRSIRPAAGVRLARR